MSRGGRRFGAGRPKKGEERPGKSTAEAAAEVLMQTGTSDAKEFLEKVVRGECVPTIVQLDAAKALLPYQHKKLGETGKKEQKNEEAAKVAGRFSQAAPPRLVTSGGKKV